MLEILLALFTAILAYILGREQGRNQTRFEKQAEVAGRIRDMLQAVENDLSKLSEYEHDWGRGDFSKGVVKSYKEVVDYGAAKACWLPPRIDLDMRAVVGQFSEIVEYLKADKGYGNLESNLFTYQQALTLAEDMKIDGQMGRIDDYTERLLGHRMSLWKVALVELWERSTLAKRISENSNPPKRSRRP